MKKLITLLLILTMTAAMTIPALAADYRFSTTDDIRNSFGTSTSTDDTVKPDPMSGNTRRNKDAAFMPPPFGIFSGDIPTDPSSPFHNNLPQSGFVPTPQNLPFIGNEDHAPGSANVTTGFLPTTSQTTSANTMPWRYEDGSIGTLHVERTGRNIKVYEGTDDSTLARGAGHFPSTSAWDGNVALAGHNRGNNAHFSFIASTEIGDTLTFATRYGTRSYRVTSITRINEWDNTPLIWTSENRLTLITCVANTPELRYAVVATEIR
jgi:sortase A